jgi:hypothetical protein
MKRTAPVFCDVALSGWSLEILKKKRHEFLGSSADQILDDGERFLKRMQQMRRVPSPSFGLRFLCLSESALP